MLEDFSIIIKFNRYVEFDIDNNSVEVKKGHQFEGYKMPIDTSMLAVKKCIIKLKKGGQKEEIVKTLNSEESCVFAYFFYILDQFYKLGLIDQFLWYNDTPMVCIYSTDEISLSDLYKVKDRLCYYLSKFVYQRVIDNQLLLETPLSSKSLVILDKNIQSLIFSLRKPCSIQNLDLNTKYNKILINLLSNAKMLEDEEFAGSNTIQQWEFHDLLFHSRTRLGRHKYSYGGVYPFKGQISQLEAIKKSKHLKGKVLKLTKQNISNSASLNEVMMSRKSIREHDEKSPIKLSEVEELLYRTSHILSEFTMNNMEFTKRPYPSGGAAYELELYLCVNRCNGIDHGMYYYHPKEHALYSIACNRHFLEQILLNAQRTYNGTTPPQLLINITSRFSRIAWKYRSMSYALTLKHLGVMYHNLYLVGTDMNIAVCALGGGDSQLFSDATGINYYEEPLIGEFIIGSKKEKNGTK